MVNVFRWLHCRLRSGPAPQQPLPYICDEYYAWRDRLTTAEMLLLRALGFHVQPDRRTAVLLLISYLRALGLTERLGTRALALLNDAFRSVCPLLHPPPVLACAALELAVGDCGLAVGDCALLPAAWWSVLGAPDRPELEACMERMRQVPAIQYDPDLPMVPTELAVYARVLREANAGDKSDKEHHHHHRDHSRDRQRSDRSRDRSQDRHRRDRRRDGSRDRHEHGHHRQYRD